LESGLGQSFRVARRVLALAGPDPRLGRRALVGLAVVGVALDGVGALGIFALIRLLTDPDATLALPEFLSARAGALTGSQAALVGPFALALAALFLFKNGLRFFEAYARHRFANAAAVRLSSGLLRRYLEAPYEMHLRRGSAELIRNAHGAVDMVCRSVLISAVSAISEAFVVVGLLLVLIAAAPKATLVVGFGVGLATLLLLGAMQASYARRGQRSHALNATLMRGLQEALRGVKEIQVSSTEAYFVEAFASARRALAEVQVRSGALQVVPRLLIESLFLVAIAMIVVTDVGRGGADPELLAFLGLVAYALLRLLPSLHLLVYNLNNCRFGEAAVDGLDRDWKLELRPHPEPGLTAPAQAAFRSELRFQDVGFTYPGADEPALREIDLSVRPGESLGLVGRTGAGKSTLVDLFLGLHPPSRGRISLDGADLVGRARAWQAQLGYVSQHAFFLDDTLRRNVAMGLAAGEIDASRLERVIAMAQLAELVERLPDGLDTRIGEQGVRLSGGERQRVAIARALYRDPAVLVFDEATSALDAATEQALWEALAPLRGEKTLLVVAHRAATVRRCDRLVMLDAGRIAARGSFDELLAGDEAFRTLQEGAP
jgi:ATP-binding cassette subfamily C protein